PKFGRISATHVAPLLADVSPYLVNLQIPGIESTHSRIHETGATFSGNDEQSHDCVPIQASEPFGAADRTSLKQTMQRTHCRIGTRQKSIAGKFGVGLGKSVLAGSAFPALNAALTKTPSLNAGGVLASDAGHVVSPLALCEETSQNSLWSEAWVTPRFGLAPPTARTADGALNYGLTCGGGLIPKS